MPRNRARARAIAARARRSFVAPRQVAEGDELVVRTRQDYDDSRDEEYTKELLVLNTAGEWQPALSLFEYVQQSLVELCAGYIEASGDIAGDEGWEEYVDWRDLCDCHNAWEVYAKARYDHTTVDTLLSLVTPQSAAGIIKRRREELAGIRALRLVAVRLRVPHDVVGQIESFFAPAKDSVPCRRDELPGFMQSLCEEYVREAWDGPFECCSVSAGHVGGAEIWKGQFSHGVHSLREDWIVLPRKLLQQCVEHPFVFSHPDDDENEWPAGAIEVLESAPGHRTYLFEDADGGQHARTFECFVLHPYFVELKRQAEERRRAHHRLYEEQRAQRRVRMQLELAGLERGRRPHEVASRAAGSALAVAAGALLVWAISAAEASVA